MARADQVEKVYWWSADAEVLPTAAGWTATGTATVSLGEDHVRVQTSSNVYTWSRPLAPGDPPSRQRVTDHISAQVRLRARELTSGWPGPPAGILLRDGARHVLLALGTRAAFLHPVSGEILLESAGTYGWERWSTLRVEKRGAAAWTAWVDGEQAIEIPYLLAPTMAVGSAEVVIGVHDASAEVDLDLDAFEVGLNVVVPQQWVVDRTLHLLPAVVRKHANARHRALLRAMVGAAANAWDAIRRTQERRSSARIDIDIFEATGLQDPTTLAKAWTADDPTGLSLVRQRIQIESPGTTVNLYADFGSFAAWPDDVELQLRARGVFMASWTVDGTDHLGPYLYLSDGDRYVYAVLMELTGGGYGWILSDNGPGGGSPELGEGPWRVDPRQPHDVEIRFFGNQYVVLLVDGQIVNRMSYGDLGTTSDHVATVALAHDGVMFVEELRAAAVCSSMSPRPEFGRWLLTHLLPTGGCERNDEMQCWLEHMTGSRVLQRPTPGGTVEAVRGQLALRGTERGIVLELRRICCDLDCYVITEESYAAWFVDLSFPMHTPVFVDAGGYILDLFVEFTWGPPGIGLTDFVNWLAIYLVPASTGACTYWLCLLTKITGASSTPSAGVTRYPVTSTRFFEVGDEVHLREAGGTGHESVEVVAVGASTVDVTSPTSTYGADDFIRKPIRTT